MCSVIKSKQMKPTSFKKRERKKIPTSTLIGGMIKQTRTKDSVTDNMAVTHSTSLDACVDMFFMAGATRRWKKEDKIKLFIEAYSRDKELAFRILFWSRDVRGGAGERQFFRDIYSWSMDPKTPPAYRKSMLQNLRLIPEYGRWDDLWEIDNLRDEDYDFICSIIFDGLEAEDGLLAKWLPRKGLKAKIIRDGLGLSPRAYRKKIVGLSKTVEQQMSAKQWNDINYSHVPSQAMNKYRKAFYRNDETRFTGFIDKVNKGEVQIKAKTLFPYQLYQAYEMRESSAAIEAQWNSLPNYMSGSTERILPVCDVSGSMTSLYGFKSSITPIDVSVSLGVYISERNRSIFRDAFITFSSTPSLQHLKGSVTDRFEQLRRAEWGMSTNLQAVFTLVLNTAIENGLPEEEMPTKILIISDMQFNYACSNTNLEAIKSQYQIAGYKIPQLIFWNVNAKLGNVPAQIDERGVGLVSGFSPSILKSILQGKIESPQELMLKTINSERYSVITA